MTYSLPSITYTVTVPHVVNANHTVVCNGANPITDRGATINWTYTDPTNDIQTNYQVQIATDSTFNSIIHSIVAPANTNVSSVRNAAISGLNPNTRYYARVRAYNNANLWSNYSVCAGSFTTTNTPSCPAGQIRNPQGVCEPIISRPGGPCDGDSICDLDE